MQHAVPLTDRDVNIMALTVYGEARGEPYDGQKAVVWVIRNRAEFARQYRTDKGQDYAQFGDGSPASACLARAQFSCWNSDDPNCLKMKALLWQGNTDAAHMTAGGLSNPAIQRAMDVIDDVFSEDAADDPTNGAEFYHTTNVHPAWARGLKPVLTVGAHVFYNNVDHVDNPAFDWSLPTDPDPPPSPTSTASPEPTQPPEPASSGGSSLRASPSPYAPSTGPATETTQPFFQWLFASLRSLFTAG